VVDLGEKYKIEKKYDFFGAVASARDWTILPARGGRGGTQYSIADRETSYFDAGLSSAIMKTSCRTMASGARATLIAWQSAISVL